MDIIILLSFFITLIQLGGAYLRYLPFAPLLSAERRRFLLQCFLIWGSIDNYQIGRASCRERV